MDSQDLDFAAAPAPLDEPDFAAATTPAVLADHRIRTQAKGDGHMGENLAKFFVIAKKDCCNYVAVGPWGKANYCLTLGSCVLKEDKFCKWFGDAVIAYGPYRRDGLQTQWQELWQAAPTKILNRMCRVCGDEFRQTSPRQVFCLKCRKLNQTEKARLRKRKERK